MKTVLVQNQCLFEDIVNQGVPFSDELIIEVIQGQAMESLEMLYSREAWNIRENLF